MNSKECRNPNNPSKPLKCVHCDRIFKNPHGLLEHIQYHGQLRYCCSLCARRFPSTFSLKLHMRSKHGVTSTITTPLVANKTDQERDEFVLRPVPLIEETPIKAETEKEMFSPDQIDELPKRSIFTSEIKCSLCPYGTKVRSNLVRHLQFHSAEKSVPETAPVNPVPCLEKNEKMFDKMTNLAISSFTGGSGSRMGGGGSHKTETKDEKELEIPAYVPLHRRYVCCAPNCNYLCLEEGNLRHHLYALHVQESSYKCAHCKAPLKTEIEGYLKHLKLHDLHLYKCSHCLFVHNLRHKVDKHSNDKHQGQTTSTITIRALEAELKDSDQTVTPITNVVSEATPTSNIKWTKPWHCGVCKYRCATKDEIVTHINNKHDINSQYKCTLCLYKTNEKKTFDEHFKENHPGNDIDIIYVYYKSEGAALRVVTSGQKQFDTTPLWQRDRPRVRHIRGILFEESPQKGKRLLMTRPSTSSTNLELTVETGIVLEESPQKSKKNLMTTRSSTTVSNLDLAIEAVAKGLDECTSEKDESVILIDDEDDLMIHDDSNDAVDIEKIDESTKIETEKTYLSEEILIRKYGKLRLPVNGRFRCPICMRFKTKRISLFVYHILEEMKVYRFVLIFY